MIEAILRLQERVLRNLALAAAAGSGDDRDWHLAAASEMQFQYLKEVRLFKKWLALRGVTYP